MDFLADPQIWISLLTLTGLEIVLGIDNVIFISILAPDAEPVRAGSLRPPRPEGTRRRRPRQPLAIVEASGRGAGFIPQKAHPVAAPSPHPSNASRRARIFSSVSANSAAGSDPSTIPAPA